MAILFYQVHTHAKLKDKLFCGKLARIYDNNDCDKYNINCSVKTNFFQTVLLLSSFQQHKIAFLNFT